MSSFQEEFLLSAPGALGMFTASTGISQHPPLQWSNNLLSVVCLHPYILALNDEFITVHRYLLIVIVGQMIRVDVVLVIHTSW